MNKETNDYEFQEFCRVMDATAGKYNYEGLLTGRTCLDFILSQVYHIKGFVSDELLKLIIDEIELSQGKSNVREHVKKILTYPLKGYLPWRIIDTNVSFESFQKLNNINFRFVIQDGKVYGYSPERIAEIIYNELKQILPESIVLNPETPNDTHITLVNSNVVYDIGFDNVLSFVDRYSNIEFNVEFGQIKSAESYDWSPFSECYVIGIRSDAINYFLSDFNTTFNKNLKPFPHITFAIKSRALF